MNRAIRMGFLALCFAFAWQSLVIAKPGRTPHSRRVLGVVVQTDQGRLDNSLAQEGADVYSCDRLETDPSGVLRVRVGASQMFLSSTSLAALEDDGIAIQGLAMAGTVGFASSPNDSFSLRTPAGIVRPAGQAATGQVTYAGPQKLIISALRGDLTLDTGGVLRTIPDGRSAEVTFDGDVDNSCHDEGAAEHLQERPYARPKIGFYLIAGGVAAIPVYFGWRDVVESETKTSK